MISHVTKNNKTHVMTEYMTATNRLLNAWELFPSL